MGLITNRYRASNDPARFDKHQTLDQQRDALRSLSYRLNGVMDEIGTIEELRLAIMENGETIPGRSAQESIELVEEIIAEHRMRAEEYLAERNAKMRRIYVRAAIFVFAALVAINAPTVARLIGG